MYCRTQRRTTANGFSLAEVMVVLVIIGLLGGLVTVSVRAYLTHAKQKGAQADIARIADVLETFFGEYDRYPNAEEKLDILTRPNKKFSDALLKKLPKDPWGNPYEYIPLGNRDFELICYGADGREGGSGADADISNKTTGEE